MATVNPARTSSALAVSFLGASVVACGGAANVAPPPQPIGNPAESPTASDALPAPGTYELDPPHTFVVWSAKHKIVGAVRGRFDKIVGTLVVAQDPAACTVDATIEAPSFAMTRELVDEIGTNATGFDVGIEIDAEALAKEP
jgi:polyisoprenoid-binding protein YceI